MGRFVPFLSSAAALAVMAVLLVRREYLAPERLAREQQEALRERLFAAPRFSRATSELFWSDGRREYRLGHTRRTTVRETDLVHLREELEIDDFGVIAPLAGQLGAGGGTLKLLAIQKINRYRGLEHFTARGALGAAGNRETLAFECEAVRRRGASGEDSLEVLVRLLQGGKVTDRRSWRLPHSPGSFGALLAGGSFLPAGGLRQGVVWKVHSLNPLPLLSGGELERSEITLKVLGQETRRVGGVPRELWVVEARGPAGRAVALYTDEGTIIEQRAPLLGGELIQRTQQVSHDWGEAQRQEVPGAASRGGARRLPANTGNSKR